MALKCTVSGAPGFKRTFNDLYSSGEQILANDVSFFAKAETDFRRIMLDSAKEKYYTTEDEKTVRASRAAHRVCARFRGPYKWDFLFQKIPCPKSDATAFPLSPQAREAFGADYVTYKHPAYRKAITATYDRIIKKHLHLVDLEDARQLLTDYSWWVPAANEVKRDGAWRCDGEYSYHSWRLKYYRDRQTEWWRAFLQRPDEELMKLRPKVHTDKSLGAYQMTPEGKILTSDDLLIAARPLFKGQIPSGVWARKVTCVNKLDFANKRVPLRAAAFLYENRDRLFEESVIQEGVQHMYYPVAKNAFRNNEYPGFVGYEDEATAEQILKTMETKPRPLSLYVGEGKFFHFTIDGEYSRAAAKADGRLLARGKHRLMFPSANNCVTPVGIFAFRLFDDPSEHGERGFPSLDPETVKSWNDNLRRFISQYKTVILVKVDRSNSEQYMTDNSDNFTQLLYPERFNELRRCYSTCICPGNGQPRMILNGTPSGGATTSGDNKNTGEFDFADLVDLCLNRWHGEVFKQMIDNAVITQHLASVLKTPFGAIEVLKPAGLDDQMGVFGTNDLTEEKLCHLFQTDEVRAFCDARKLKMELIRRDQWTKFFGMVFDLRTGSFYYDGRNTASKLPLDEHGGIGDQKGFRKFIRWRMLPPELREDFDAGFSDAGLIKNSFAEYEPCVGSYFRNLSRYGLSVLDEFNNYNPTDKIIASKLLKEYQLHDSTWAVYSDEVVYEWLDFIRKITL